MRTVHPSIMIGSYVWEQDRVPRDEFQARIEQLHRVMDAGGLKAMLVYGDAAEHSALAWFSNFAPRLRWGMALLPREGEPRLLISMSSRDVPAMKLTTWIPDVMSGWTWESAFDPWLARLNADHPIDLGTVGFDMMRPPLFGALEKSLGNRFRLQAADVEVAAVRALRPRERSQLRDASTVVGTAADAIVQAWRAGMNVEAAALEGERTARLLAVQDVRTLVSFDGGRTLSPYRGVFEPTSGPLIGYIAVKHRGYWAEMFVTAGQPSDALRRAQAGLEAVVRAARPGIAADTLHAMAIEPLGVLPLHPVLSGSVGRRIGLSLNEGGEIRHGSSHMLVPGEMYAFHVGTRDSAGGALVSAMIVITANGAELLHRSPDASAPQASVPATPLR
jgi:Xaa-Pro aminopeptidase